MRQVSEPVGFLRDVCRKQRFDTDTVYRQAYHCLMTPCEDGILLYQTLTQETLLLSQGEWNTVSDDEVLRRELVERYFLVSPELDEAKHADQVLRLARLLSAEKEKISSFLIFTTLDCNARCFYCYELGRPRPVMTEQTAHDVAQYIEKVSSGEPVKLRWFGGEPLFNSTVIDVITGDLRRKGIAYSSYMVSNGYLFDSELVRRAREDWILKNVQITLDGTESVYNKTKAFIYHDGSPFRRVLNNIGLLLDAGIAVRIRLNTNHQNAEDLSVLIDELALRFGGRKGFSAYVALLLDFGHETVRTFEADDTAIEAFVGLMEKLRRLGLLRDERIEGAAALRIGACMADSDSAVTILPDGRLGKCEHETVNNLIGSIYSDELDTSMIDAWKERYRQPECASCAAYPVCYKLKKCDWMRSGCTPLMQRQMLFRLGQKVRLDYEKMRREL